MKLTLPMTIIMTMLTILTMMKKLVIRSTTHAEPSTISVFVSQGGLLHALIIKLVVMVMMIKEMMIKMVLMVLMLMILHGHQHPASVVDVEDIRTDNDSADQLDPSALSASSPKWMSVCVLYCFMFFLPFYILYLQADISGYIAKISFLV